MQRHLQHSLTLTNEKWLILKTIPTKITIHYSQTCVKGHLKGNSYNKGQCLRNWQ